MSESTFPFAGAAQPDPSAEQEVADSRRPLAVAAGLIAALVLGAGGFLLLGGDDDDAVALGPPPAVVPAADPQVQEPVLKVVPAAATSPIGRNPFRANYIAPPAVTTTGDTGSTDGATTGGGSTGGGSTGGGFTGGGSTGGGSTGGGSAGGGGSVDVGLTGPGSAGGPTYSPPAPGAGGTQPTGPVPAQSVIVLTGVTDKDGVLTATFTVDGVTQTIAIGDIFGARKQVALVSLHEGPLAAQWTAVIRVGDATPVDMVTGENITINN